MTRRSLLLRFRLCQFGLSCVLLSSLLSTSVAAQGVSRVWSGGGATDNWFNPSNWSPVAPPNPADFLKIGFLDIAGLNTNDVDITYGGRIEIDSSAVVTLHNLDIGLDGEGTLDMSAGTLTTNTTYIGQNGNSFGTANISGEFSQWNITNSLLSDLYVGNSGEGRLHISSEADVVVADDGIIGFSSTSIGTVDISGSGSTLYFTGANSSLTVGSSGLASLNISNRAAVSNHDSVIAESSTSVASVMVDSAGIWTNTGSMTIASSGTGTMEIRGGGAVTSTSIGTIAYNTSGVGRVWVDGTDSGWVLASPLEVGYGGTGQLEISGGGRVQNTLGKVASNPGSNGSVIVRDNGSIWANSNSLYLGFLGGKASLLITDGGTVENTDANIGFESISMGIVTVEGAGSTWTNSGSIHIGHEGNGTLHIAGGATVTSNSSLIGLASYSIGTVNVSGGGSHWNNSGLLVVGDRGYGTLNITGGALVTSLTGSVGRFAEAGEGAGDININGAGSRWDVTGSGTIELGKVGDATLDISDGGALITPGSMSVASTDTSTSSVTVAGIGSRLELDIGLSLGNGGGTGTGSATIGAGAQVTVGTSTVIQNANSSLAIDGGSLTTTSLSNNGGTFAFNSGTVTVNGGTFDPGSSDYSLNGNSTAMLILQGNASSAINGIVTVGNTGDAVLTIRDGHHFTSGELTIGASGELVLDGGHLTAEQLNNFAGGTFTFRSGTVTMTGDVFQSSSPVVIPQQGTIDGSGYVEAEIHGHFGSTITVTSGSYILGDPSSFLGFVHEGTLNVGSNIANLKSAGFAQIGALTTLAGGTITAANGVVLGIGDNISGNGNVNTRLAAGFGSTISANGSLSLGDSATPIGFSSDGMLNVGSNTVTLNDSNAADLGALTTLTTGGMLDVANGAVIDFTDNVTGEGLISSPDDSTKPIINNGSIVGDSLLNPITLNGYVKGVGTCDNCNITGTDAPGFSPAAVNRGSVSYNGTLEIEIGGLNPGSDFDQLNHILGAGIADLGGRLDVSLINSFMPSIGDSFEIITAVDVDDVFAVENLPPIGGLLWNVNYNATNVVLAVVSPFSADFDQDGDVDGNDFLVWQRNPSVGSLGDWQTQHGNVLPLAAIANVVPEPASLTLFFLLGSLRLVCRKLRRMDYTS
ncbi:hypothetical protein [Bythopirellula polymerisocia]|uniref:Putative lipoprotein n=1 Tax=Bythopirellula polymerisocia TaxID=2528003 RepID=A0A5C6CY49_9BACT|nr:hypothetical protein [Bythopirellula polymerisocia]TWU28477.1 putative lipoprotein [Bythopirellula polymerisocia]